MSRVGNVDNGALAVFRVIAVEGERSQSAVIHGMARLNVNGRLALTATRGIIN